MKRIDAIIRPFKLEAVTQRLQAAGVEGVTVTEVRGFGRQKGQTELYRGTEYPVPFVPKVLLTILARDEYVEPILTAIVAGARTGKVGDGKALVAAVEDVVRIRTGERGLGAL